MRHSFRIDPNNKSNFSIKDDWNNLKILCEKNIN